MIRNAEAADSKEVLELVKALNVLRDSNEETAFIEYPSLTEEGYIRRIQNNPFFLVAASAELLGFAAGYSDEFLQALNPDDKIMQYIMKKSEDFVYLDQFAVQKLHRRKKIAFNLYRELLYKAYKYGKHCMYGAVAHAPKRNNVAIGMLSKWGFLQEEEIIIDDMTFGLYKKLVIAP